jgi:hypothetical protein
MCILIPFTWMNRWLVVSLWAKIGDIAVNIADMGLGGVAQQRVEVVGAVILAAVGDFLAPDAERRPPAPPPDAWG